MAFHWKDNWHFERFTEANPEKDNWVAKEGWVRIYHVSAQTKEGDQNIDVDLEIDPDSWASIIASVCQEGDTGRSYRLARALHGVSL